MRRSVALLLCAGATFALILPEKRAEMSPVPFVLGSRYGRSPPRLMTPRNDRFFLGSRYGKRSDNDLEPPRDQQDSGDFSHESPSHVSRDVANLFCDYTGVLTLYRCTKVATDHRREDSRGTGDGK